MTRNVPGSWDWRGLVVGDVQSGKTASYAGVVNRAADAGYRIIIVLAGMHKILRLQTQKRFDKDFLGYDTNPENAAPNQPMRIIGVGNFNAQLIVDSLTMADPERRLQSDAWPTRPISRPSASPACFIVKKNAKVLENLNNWIARLPGPAKAAPVLVIDDESDQASVDTGDQPLLEDGTFDAGLRSQARQRRNQTPPHVVRAQGLCRLHGNPVCQHPHSR